MVSNGIMKVSRDSQPFLQPGRLLQKALGGDQFRIDISELLASFSFAARKMRRSERERLKSRVSECNQPGLRDRRSGPEHQCSKSERLSAYPGQWEPAA